MMGHQGLCKPVLLAKAATKESNMFLSQEDFLFVEAFYNISLPETLNLPFIQRSGAVMPISFH